MIEVKRKVITHKWSSVIAISSLLMVFIIGGVLAYLKDSEQVENVFTIGDVNIELIEKVSGTAGEANEVLWNTTLSNVTGRDGTGNSVTVSALANICPNQIINKQPYIKNIGKNSSYVYMKVAVPKITINGNPTPLFSYSVNSGWTLGETSSETIDGITYDVYKYKYNTALEPNNVTTTLFDNISVSDTDLSPAELDTIAEVHQININAYGIQSDGITLAQGYNEFFTLME